MDGLGQRWFCMVVIGLVAASLLAGAAQAEKPDRIFNLKLEPHPEQEGVRVVGVQGTATAAGHGFVVEGLSVFEPVDVILISEDPDRVLTLELYKYRFDEPLRRVTTDADGHAVAKLYTQGDLRIRVRGREEGGAYTMVVRVGKEEIPELPPVVVTPEEAGVDAGGSAGKLVVILALVGAGFLAGLGLLAGVWLVYQSRRRKEG